MANENSRNNVVGIVLPITASLIIALVGFFWGQSETQAKLETHVEDQFVALREALAKEIDDRKTEDKRLWGEISHIDDLQKNMGKLEAKIDHLEKNQDRIIEKIDFLIHRANEK